LSGTGPQICGGWVVDGGGWCWWYVTYICVPLWFNQAEQHDA
jgi:hypothetical protein